MSPSGGLRLGASSWRSKPRPPVYPSPCSLPQTQGLPPATTTSGEHSTRLLRRSGTSEHHPRGEGASPFRSGRISAQRSRAQGPSAPKAGPGRRRPSARSAWHKALHPSCREQAPDATSVLPPVPDGPKPEGTEDQAAHGQVASACKTRCRPPARGGGSKLPLLCTLDPPDATKHEARRCRNADPAGQSRCPRRRANSHVRQVSKANLHDLRYRPPSLATTRVTSPGSALP
jgi:hypothetical protein